MRMDIISSQPIFHRCPVVMMLFENKQSIIYIQINKKKKDYIILMKYIIRIEDITHSKKRRNVQNDFLKHDFS